MKFLMLVSALLLFGCSLETKDGCSSSGSDQKCESTKTPETPPVQTTPPVVTTDPKTPASTVTAVKCTASADTGTGCVWGQVASGGSSLRIGDSQFNDAADFARYITQMLYEVGENVDVNGDNLYLTFKSPREITNTAFVSKFKATLVGPEIKSPIVYPEQGNLIASKLLPGDYTLRTYASFDLVEKDVDNKTVVSKCLLLENKTAEITVVPGQQTLLKPIDTFTLSIYDGSCSDSSSNYRSITLPVTKPALPDDEDSEG